MRNRVTTPLPLFIFPSALLLAREDSACPIIAGRTRDPRFGVGGRSVAHSDMHHKCPIGRGLGVCLEEQPPHSSRT
jgi:hypothetical protein